MRTHRFGEKSSFLRQSLSNIRSECECLNMRSRRQRLKQGLRYFVGNPTKNCLQSDFDQSDFDRFLNTRSDDASARGFDPWQKMQQRPRLNSL